MSWVRVAEGITAGVRPWQAWFGIGVLVLIGLCVAGRRDQFARVLTVELSPARFPDATGDLAEQAPGSGSGG